jgi:hypothetical protein
MNLSQYFIAVCTTETKGMSGMCIFYAIVAAGQMDRIVNFSEWSCNSMAVRDPTHPHILGSKKPDASQKFRRNWTLTDGTRTLPRFLT